MFEKTRIWRGGVSAASQPEAQPRSAQRDERVDTVESSRQQLGDDFRLDLIEPELEPTRHLPIEMLLGDEGRTTTSKVHGVERSGRLLAIVRSKSRVMLWSTVILAAGAYTLVPAQREVAAASLAPAAHAAVLAEPAPAKQDVVRSQHVVPAPQTGGLERKAVDAMAAGDFALAESLYVQLEAKRSGTPAVREALRILREYRRAQP